MTTLTMSQLKEVYDDAERQLRAYYDKCVRDVEEMRRKTNARNEAMVAYYDVYKQTEEWKQEIKQMDNFNDFINNRGDFKGLLKMCAKYKI